MMEPPAGMCSTTFCARLIIPMMLTAKVCSRRSREICVKSSTASPYMHAHMLSAHPQHWLLYAADLFSRDMPGGVHAPVRAQSSPKLRAGSRHLHAGILLYRV